MSDESMGDLAALAARFAVTLAILEEREAVLRRDFGAAIGGAAIVFFGRGIETPEHAEARDKAHAAYGDAVAAHYDARREFDGALVALRARLLRNAGAKDDGNA